jgi:hypothetical protein
VQDLGILPRFMSKGIIQESSGFVDLQAALGHMVSLCYFTVVVKSFQFNYTVIYHCS